MYTLEQEPSFGLNRGFAFENSPTPSPRASPAFLQDNEVFHTPCFGDDDFNLESLTTCKSSTNLSAQTTQHSIQPTAYTMSQAQGNMDLSQPSANQSGMSILETLERLAPKFPPQDFEVPDISVTNSDLFSSSINNTRLHSLSIPLVSNASSLSNRPVSVAGSSQGSVSTGFQNHTGASSPTSTGSNMTVSPLRESSEDSDDCLPLAQLAIKRQAQDDTVPEVKGAKKPRTPKKRKKKDPNEPQKPVSAYALFFRDTQAAIKGQNSSASFGEVSKIVASMWEGLDPEHKNVYKKKTEVAKKEYLKQLAAYRASLVSQTALDDQGHNDEVSSSPPRLSPHRMSAANLNPPDVQIGMMSDMSPPHPQVYGVGSPRHQGMMGALSPPHPALHNGSSPPHMKYGNGSPQYAMMGSPSHVMSQPLQQQSMVSYLQSPPHSLSYSSPLHGDLSPVSAEPSSGGILAPGMCIRNGCTNRAIDNVGWDSEYCSNECVVSHCRDVFTAWVAARQATGNSYIIK